MTLQLFGLFAMVTVVRIGVDTAVIEVFRNHEDGFESGNAFGSFVVWAFSLCPHSPHH
jgi:hypothetical protein